MHMALCVYLHIMTYTCTYIYIYIYLFIYIHTHRERDIERVRERDIEGEMYVYVHVYMYMSCNDYHFIHLPESPDGASNRGLRLLRAQLKACGVKLRGPARVPHGSNGNSNSIE